jgi:hypothetical protein
MPKKCREWLLSSVHFLDAPVTDCRFDKPARLLPGPLVNFDVKHVRKKDKKILEKKRGVGETRTQSSIEGSVQTFRGIIQLDEDHRNRRCMFFDSSISTLEEICVFRFRTLPSLPALLASASRSRSLPSRVLLTK